MHVVYMSTLCWEDCQPNTHTHTFNGSFSGTTRVSRYQKGKTNLDFIGARYSEWQWHQLGRMQVCTSLQTDNHASTPPLKFFTGRMPFLPPNQQRQSTEGTIANQTVYQILTSQPTANISVPKQLFCTSTITSYMYNICTVCELQTVVF